MPTGGDAGGQDVPGDLAWLGRGPGEAGGDWLAAPICAREVRGVYGFGPAARSILPLRGHPDARGLGPYTVLQEARTAQGRTAERRGRGCPESLDRLGTRKEEGGAKTEQTQGGQVGGRQAVAGESSAVDRRWACTAVRGQGCSCFRKDCESLGVEEARKGTEKAGDGAEDVQGL